MVTIFTSIQDQIDLVEDQIRAQSVGNHPELSAALEHLLSSGGKRVRPTVTILAGEMFGAAGDRLITLAAAIELLHTATLVHDDLIDGSLLRRGSPTLNAQWSPAATVLAGDFLFARAANLAADVGSVGIMQLFAETLTTIVNGEINQLFKSRGMIDRQDYFRRIYAKTASMFELAMKSTAILVDASDETINEAQKVGYDLGIAFQIVDDVLDFTGKQTTVGKPVANDLRHGLVTLPALYYHDAHPEDPNLRAVLSGKGYSEDQLIQLVSDIRKSGAIDSAMDEAQRHVNQAVALMLNFPPCPEREALQDLALYIVERRE